MGGGKEVFNVGRYPHHPELPPRRHFVLVHGASHGAWCWYKVRCLMEGSGYKVTCLDLKASGIDPSDPKNIVSFSDYNNPLLDFLSSLPEDEQVILVGHSAGGLNVTEAIYRFADKIRLAIFVAAVMLKNGFATDQDIVHEGPQISDIQNADHVKSGSSSSEQFPTTGMLHDLQITDDQTAYDTCPQEDVTLSLMLLRPGTSQVIRSAKFTTGYDEEELKKVPRVYIRTTRDGIWLPSQQDEMIKRWPPSSVFELESGHSPFFSSPFLLTGLLINAANS